MASEKYAYAPLPAGHWIRLLTLQPGAPGSRIDIELGNALLDSRPDYEALSYEWGLPGLLKVPNYHNAKSNSLWDLDITIQLQAQVYSGGHALVITKNLHGILNQLRHAERKRVLWIDGICINQEDVDERREQVLLMQRIYTQATKVLMWIGESKTGTERAFHLVRELARAYDERQQPTDPRQVEAGHLGNIVIEESVLAEVKKERWPDLVDVFTRPYFGRVWVVQEIVMATAADVLCGAYRVVPWPDMYKAMLIIFVLGLIVDEDPHQLPPEARVRDSHVRLQLKAAEKPETQNRRLWGRMHSIGRVWGSRSAPKRQVYTLDTLADFFLGHEVTDPRDRIYGMLGMVDAESMCHGRALSPIQPDYKKSVDEVYRDACEWSIHDSQSLAMLGLCDAPATNVLKSLPTWVPDLTSGVRKCRLITDNRDAPRIGRPLSVCFGSQFKISFDKGRDVLTTNGLIIDTVTYHSLPCTQMIKHIIAMEAFQSFCLDQRPYPTGDSRIDAVWRTLLTNRISTGPSIRSWEEVPAEFGSHFVANMTGNFRYHLGLPDRLTGSEPGINTLADTGNWSLRRMYPEDVEANISILALMARRPFIRYLFEKANVGDSQKWEDEFSKRDYIAYGDEGRQFVATERGFTGLGPRCPPLQYVGNEFMLQPGSYVVAGDVVAVLAGSDKVWYLRRDSNGQAYRIVGHGYVYGVMEGRFFPADKTPSMQAIDLR